MIGRDWFVVGARLIGLGVGYFGFQHVMTYLTRGMFFAPLDSPFELHPNPSWVLLVNGMINLAFAWFLLMKTDMLAGWCYGQKQRAVELPDDGAQESERDKWDDDDAPGAPVNTREATDVPSAIEKKDSLEI